MAIEHLAAELERLRAAGLLREPPVSAFDENPGLNCASNDYLGYARDVSRETSLGAGASRLIYGTAQAHLELEARLAAWVNLESALLFSSGYAANLGVLQALAGPGDVILSDALNHASIIDGCRLSRAEVRIVPHLSIADYAAELHAVRDRRCWVVTESFFSMDGDGPDLSALRALTDEHGAAALVVDEAHALGVFGEAGSGLCSAAGVRPDVLVGTLGKALGSSGAFVAGTSSLRTYLWNRARSLVFSTATSPAVAQATLETLERCITDTAGRACLLQRAQQLTHTLRCAGVPLPEQHLAGPIVPVIFGSNQAALSAAARLAEHGFLAQAIRPPTVPKGTARLRITLHPGLTAAQVEQLGKLLSEQWKQSSSSEPELT